MLDEFDFDEFDECFEEPGEADMIIQKAIEDVEMLYTEKVKKSILDAKMAERRLNELKTEISTSEFVLHGFEKKIEEAKQSMEKIEKEDMPKKYIDAFVRDATGFYAPGDEVWVTEARHETEECTMCRGNKSVRVLVDQNQFDIQCPKCSGRGKRTVTRWYAEQKKISSVELQLCFREKRVSYWNTECIHIAGKDYRVSPAHIHRTREEAEKDATHANAVANSVPKDS